MLSVLLMILKIIGYILLSILGLILLILLLLLNIPLRYRARVIKDEEFAASGVVSWLLHIVQVTVSYSDDLHYKVRVFGITVVNSDKEEKHEDDTEDSEDAADIKDALIDDDMPKSGDDVPGVQLGITEQLEQLEEDTSDSASEDTSQAVLSEETAKILEDMKNREALKEEKQDENKAEAEDEDEESSESKESIVGKIKNIYNKYVTDETKKLVKLSFRQIVRLLKHILPRRIRGDISFGSDDPATTGYVTAIVAALYGKLRKSFKFTPNFTEEELVVHASLKGHIRVITLLLIALRVVISKDFRYTLKLIKGKNESDESDESDDE